MWNSHVERQRNEENETCHMGPLLDIGCMVVHCPSKVLRKSNLSKTFTELKRNFADAGKKFSTGRRPKRSRSNNLTETFNSARTIGDPFAKRKGSKKEKQKRSKRTKESSP